MARAKSYHKFNKKLISKIGTRIRYHRKRQRLTLETLGYMSKVNYNYLQRIETGKINPSISVLYSISKALHISLKNLFSGV